MGVGNLVDGDGWISDESDFYGDEAMQYILQARIGHAPIVQIVPSGPRGVKRKAEVTLKQATLDSKKSSGVYGFDVVHPLKTRPEIDRSKNGDVASVPTASNSATGEAGNQECCSEDSSALQLRETVTEFLRRAPIAKASTADLGPWLWVHSRKSTTLLYDRESKPDVAAFTENGSKMLGAFTEQREKMEAVNPGATPATITRKMGPLRDQLQDDLLKLAVESRVTCGKWMLFPSDEDYPRWWRIAVEATSEGKLGPTSKAATYNAVDPLNLICFYTNDFTDLDDVKRVLEELISLGLCLQGKPLYYKCDAYTHLDIMSTNPYRLRASLYSSKEILGHEARPKKNGSLERVIKKT